MPEGADISSPLWPDGLVLPLLPKRQVIIPDIGFIKLMPRFTFLVDAPVTLPEEIEAIYVTFGFGASYNFDTHFSTEVNFLVSVSYFSTIPISFLFWLFFFLSCATTFSASSKVSTYTFSFLSSVIA